MQSDLQNGVWQHTHKGSQANSKMKASEKGVQSHTAAFCSADTAQ